MKNDREQFFSAEIRKRLSKDKKLEPWVKKLVSRPKTRKEIQLAIVKGIIEKHDRLFNCSVFGQDEGGCIDIQNIREIITYFFSQPRVYYFGIGNVSHGLDLIVPLLATDFQTLIGTDIFPAAFDNFQQAVKANLALTGEVDLAKIKFKQVTEDRFEANFVYKNRKREVICIFNFDAEKNYPSELKKGYEVLFTRRTGTVFSGLSFKTMRGLFDNLVFQGLVAFDEQVFCYIDKNRVFSKKEFLEIDLRDYFSTDSRWFKEFERFRYRRIFIKKKKRS
jgi:hypothetical protein